MRYTRKSPPPGTRRKVHIIGPWWEPDYGTRSWNNIGTKYKLKPYSCNFWITSLCIRITFWIVMWWCSNLNQVDSDHWFIFATSLWIKLLPLPAICGDMINNTTTYPISITFYISTTHMIIYLILLYWYHMVPPRAPCPPRSPSLNPLNWYTPLLQRIWSQILPLCSAATICR